MNLWQRHIRKGCPENTLTLKQVIFGHHCKFINNILSTKFLSWHNNDHICADCILINCTKVEWSCLLLHWGVIPDISLQFDKLSRHLISRPLGQNPQDCPARLIHLDPTTERKPTGTRTLTGKIHICTNISRRDI